MIKNFSELLAQIGKFKGITDDSRQVRKGFIFVAVKGRTSDGHDYISEAIKNGAEVVVGEKTLQSKTNYIKVIDSRNALGELASNFYGKPSEKIKVIGVTGTKGKTTTAHLIYHILNESGKKTGLVSSITAIVGSKEKDTGFHVTSPDVISLHKFLKEMVDAGCKYAVLEVSSHGIDQKRVAGVNFEVGVLTNIAPEHLDYHKTFKEYKKVKMSFVNSARYKVIAPTETKLQILPGKFNNLNAEVAILAVGHLGLGKDNSLKAIKSFKLPKGRLEEIENNLGFRIFIDFAHTPDSLEAALNYFRTLTKGRVISVFGCAGERDVKKRRKMGRISGRLSDISVFTAEDPRTESLTDIFRLMKKDLPAGRQGAKNFVTIPERGEAIAYALAIAKKGDIVAFMGKGHEGSMAYKGFEHPWNEKFEIENFIKRNKEVSSIILAAGKGTRMKSSKPKILHEICGRPMIAFSLQNLRRSKVGEIITVVSYRKNLVIDKVGGAVKIAVQSNPKGGTADAVISGIQKVSKDAKHVMVLYGDDTAFYEPDTIKEVLRDHISGKAVITFITLTKENPFGLGRILRDEKDNLIGIVEEKDATDPQRKIKEVNDGLYIFDKEWIAQNLPKIKPSAVTGELYLVDLIKMAIDQKKKVKAYKLPTDSQWQGINNPEELAKAVEKMKEKLSDFSHT